MITPEILELREKFKETHECPKHELIPSQPFNTSLGEFTFRTCPVCNVAETDYDSKTYRAPQSELLNWVAHISIEADRKTKTFETKLVELGLGHSVPIKIDALFETPKTPILDIKNLF